MWLIYIYLCFGRQDLLLPCTGVGDCTSEWVTLSSQCSTEPAFTLSLIDLVTVWECCGATVWECCGVTVWECCGITVWECCGVSAWECCGVVDFNTTIDYKLWNCGQQIIEPCIYLLSCHSVIIYIVSVLIYTC